MKTTRYFREQVLRKRPYVLEEWCEAALRSPLRVEQQADGRRRIWTPVRLPGETTDRILRIVVLDDGETVHNAFLDRNYRSES